MVKAMVLAIIIAVLVDRYLDYLPGGAVIMRSRSTAWLNTYLTKMLQFIHKLGIKHNYINLLFILIPLCVILLLLKLLFASLFGTIGWVLFTAFALFYFLGNNELDPNESEFILAHERSFAILFWFAIFGPFGALLYWFFVSAKQIQVMQEPENAGLLSTIVWLHAIAAWLPARITAFIFALVGNFTGGFNCWLNSVRQLNMQSSQVLNDCGASAVDSSVTGDDVNLVNRSYFAWVVLSILIVVVFK